MRLQPDSHGRMLSQLAYFKVLTHLTVTCHPTTRRDLFLCMENVEKVPALISSVSSPMRLGRYAGTWLWQRGLSSVSDRLMALFPAIPAKLYPSTIPFQAARGRWKKQRSCPVRPL